MEGVPQELLDLRRRVALLEEAVERCARSHNCEHCMRVLPFASPLPSFDEDETQHSQRIEHDTELDLVRVGEKGVVSGCESILLC